MPAAGAKGAPLLLACDGAGGLLRLGLEPPSSTPVALQTPGAAPVAAIACQEAASVFAVAMGRYIHVLDGEGIQLRQLGPLPAPVVAVAWGGAAGDVLVAATPDALHTWSDGGAAEGPVLHTSSNSSISSNGSQQGQPYLAAAPRSPLLAASSGAEVLCWDLSALLGADSGGSPEPLRLQEFETQVTVMGWDPSGQYLATADGADLAVWDLSDPSGAARASSIACCGHEPRTAITCLAFQPDGHLLATASSSGKVAVFDCRQFRRGGVLGPVACSLLDQQAPDAATALHWLLGGRLVVAAACGLLVCMQLSEQPQAGQPQEVAAVALADSVTLMQLSPCDYEAAPPPAGPEEEDNGTATVAPDAVAAAAAVSAATAAAAAALVPCSKSSPPPAGEALPIAASLPTSTSLTAAGPGAPLNLNGHTAAGHYDAAPGLSPAAALPPIAARQASIGNGSNGNGQARPRARGARGGVGRSGDRGGDATPAGGSGGSAGFSASLMHHIQAIRDNPPQQGGGRSDHHQQLAGWGLGSPSGAHVPWMMAGQGGPMAAAPPPTSGGTGYGAAAPGGFAQFQSPTGMMQHHMGMQMPGGGPMNGYMPAGQPSSPQAQAQAAYQAQAQAAQQAMFAGMSGGAPGAMAPVPHQAAAMAAMGMGGGGGGMGLASMGSMGSMGSGGAPGGTQWVMVPASAAYMQQVQQWAGMAPGYMTYQHAQHAQQHPQQAQHGSGRASGMRHGSGGGGTLSPMSSGVFSPHGSGSLGSRTASNASGAFPGCFFPARMDSSLGGVAGTSRQASLDVTAAEAADRDSNNRASGGSPRSHGSSGTAVRASGNGGGGGSQVAAGALPAATGGGSSGARSGRELLHQLQVSQATADAASASAAAQHQHQQKRWEQREKEEEEGNDAQGSATPDAAEAAAATTAAAPPPVPSQPVQAAPQPAQRQQGDSGGSESDRSQLCSAASGDLNNASLMNNHQDMPSGSGSEASSQAYMPQPGVAVGGHPGAAADPGAITTVYVGNLPGTVDEYTLMCAFAPFGPVTHVQVIKEKGSQLSRGYGFVSFAHPIYATIAMQHMNQQVLFGPFAGSRIKVAPSKRH